MKRCPSEQELEGLLADRLSAEARTSVEGHIEACPACQQQLDALTRADLALADSHRSVDSGPAFLRRVQHEYPDTLLNGATKPATLRFPGEPTERAPLGQLGDFDILEELGSGSFGWVFRARERNLNRMVALKVLKPEMTARPEAIIRFEREAKKASLKHDHIVSVHRFEKPAGFPPYLVMEFVDGETLEAKLKREGKLVPEEAAAIARQVALGLAAAHEHGMVHRDIKPANILLDKKTGRAKISDFGLARDIANESLAVTEAGELAGTAPYMSPEHFRTPEKIDGRSDVFSLGIVLYQLLTGQLPFKGSFLQIRSGILEDEPTSPRRLTDSVPVDLETITLACLEKDPQRRFATAQALADDLRRYQTREPILCRPTGRVERAVKWVYRKPAQAMLAGVGTIAVAILAVLIAGFFVNAELERQRDKVQDAKDNLESTNGKLVAKEAVVRRLNYIADMNLAHQAWQNDNFTLLDQYLAAHKDSELCGFEWHYLNWLASTDGLRIGPKEEVTAIAFDRSGQFLAMGVTVGKSASHVQIWSPPNPEEPRGKWLQTVATQKNEIRDVALHRAGDGVTLITSDRAGAVTFWDVKQNRKLRDIAGNGPVALSPDGELLAYVHPSGGVQRWSVKQMRDVGQPLAFDAVGEPSGSDKGKRIPSSEPDKGKPRMPPTKELGKPRGSKADDDKGKARGEKPERYLNAGIEQMAFSHDGRRLAIVGGFYKTAGVLALWDLKSDQQIPIDDARQGDLLTSVAFSSDGKSVAAAGFDHVLRVADARSGKVRFHGVGHKLEVLSVAFNQKGDRIASAGWDHTIRIWDAGTGEELRNLRGSRGVVAQILFCPDTKFLGGDFIVSLNNRGELRWWNADHEQNARVTQLRDREPVHALAFSPKGKYLAALGRKDQVLIQAMAPPHSTIELGASESRGVFSDDESGFFTLGRDPILQVHPLAKDDKAVDMPAVAIAGQRVVVNIDGKWMLTRRNPYAREPLQDLLPFGNAVEPTPTLITADAAGTQLAFARSDGSAVVRRRDAETGTVFETIVDLKGQTINALAFSPNGRQLAVSVTGLKQEYAIWLWDVESAKFGHKLTGHLCFIGCLAFSPDGKRLASGSEDWTVKIWDLEAGRATMTLSGHKGRIRDLAFNPDGNHLASASEDGTIRVWPGVLESSVSREERREPSTNRAK